MLVLRSGLETGPPSGRRARTASLAPHLPSRVARRALAASKEPERIRHRQRGAQPGRAVRADGVGGGFGQGWAPEARHVSAADRANARRLCDKNAYATLADCMAPPPGAMHSGAAPWLPPGHGAERAARRPPQASGRPVPSLQRRGGQSPCTERKSGGSASAHGPLPVRRSGSMRLLHCATPLSSGCPSRRMHAVRHAPPRLRS